MSQTIYVQLGRYGDVMNILPLLYLDAQSGHRSAVMVSKEFEGIMDGVSYADKIVFDGHMWELERAVKEAEQLSPNVKVVQLVGPTEAVKNVVVTRNGQEYRTTKESFLKDQWELAGRMADWKRQPPLIFDRRDAQRELTLITQHLPKRKKVILLAASGTSSPFEFTELLKGLLTLKFGKKYSILDIGQLKCERIYDLLAIFTSEAVHCLVATDSAPLHLAYAAQRLPVAALVNDKPSLWHGSVWRPNHFFHCRYSDFPKRAFELLTAIENIRSPHSYFSDYDTGKAIVHVWSEYADSRAIDPECSLGDKYSARWIECPIEPGAIGRDTVTRLKDEKRFPFVKDVIRLATLRARDSDIICVTRTNTGFYQDIARILLESAPCYSFRRVKDENGNFTHQSTCELFAFTKKWWQDNQHDFPDMVMGKDVYWPRILMELMRLKGAKEVEGIAWTPKSTEPPVDPPKEPPPRISHNSDLYEKFLKQHNITHTAPIVSDQVKLLPLTTNVLFSKGYNPSLIRSAGKLLMAYRWHQEQTFTSSLAMAELDEQFHVIRNTAIEVEGVSSGYSIDDPRLFTYAGQLYCAYVVSTWPKMPPTCLVRYGKVRLSNGIWKIVDPIQVDYGFNNGSSMEKNWIFFERDSKLFCIYNNQPEQSVLELVDGKVASVHKSPTPHWVWGPLHGGTSPVEFDDAGLLRFFHTRMHNEPPPFKFRYYIGCCLMAPKPPFEILKVCSRPVLRGSELDDLTSMEKAGLIHHKSNVVFPGGCIRDGNDFLLSFGINDSKCAIAKFTKQDLHL